MKLSSVPCDLYTLYADNGDALLLYGTDGTSMFLWPTALIDRHRFAFARWSRQNVARFRGQHLMLQHPLCTKTKRWAQWLGVHLTDAEARI